jgi:chlorobactene glucosyltransferase
MEATPATLSATLGHWAAVGGLGLLCAAWGANLLKMLRGDVQPPEVSLTADTPPDVLPSPCPSLTVLIPARNEAPNIEACLRSVVDAGWPGRLEIVAIDDRSTDGTGEILGRLAAAEPRLRVVRGADPPAGWLGKPHALHLGQAVATGDWLLFLDADVRVTPGGLQRLLGRVIAQEAEMASVLGRLTVESFWERVVQTRMGAVIAGGNPLPEVNDPEHERALANGQCLLFRRDAYDRLGGHAAIKGSVLDDVDFAKRAKQEKVRYRLYYGPAVFSCRMYTGLNEIWQGWTKNLFPALGYSLVATAIVTLLLFTTTLLPFVLLAKNLAYLAAGLPFEPLFLGLEAAACALILATDALGHRTHGYRWSLFWTFPLGMLVVLAVFWNSAWRIKSGRGAVWKGRVVEGGPKA